MHFELINTNTDMVSISIGKKYLFQIVDTVASTNERREKGKREVEDLVSNAGNKENLNRFYLPIPIYCFLHSQKRCAALAYTLRGHEEEDFLYSFLFNHMRKFYRYFSRDRNEGKLHLCFKLEPKEPEEYGNLTDKTTRYSSVMMKFSSKRYYKYYNRGNGSKEGYTYMVCMLYFYVLGNLYRILRKDIDDIERFLASCFKVLNPVISGLENTCQYSLGEVSALSVIQELYQLHSSGRHLTIKHNKAHQCVEFIYTTLNSTFHNSLEETFNPSFRGDNYGKRLVKVLIYGEGNVLSVKVEVIGLEAINDTIGFAANKNLYDYLSSEEAMNYTTYYILSSMFSHTQEHCELKEIIEETLLEAKYNYIFGTPIENLLAERNFLAVKKAFVDITPDNSLELSKALVKAFPLNRYSLEKVGVVLSLAKLDDKEISSLISKLGSKQQAEIRKMVKFVQEYEKKLPQQSKLNSLYQKVAYKC